MKREDLCEMFEQLIDTDEEFLNKKARLYCEYCVSLDKRYVDSIVDNFYEECENYIKKLSINEELEKQFIKSYESDLALKGKEICVEVEPFTNNEFLIKKAISYCQNIHRLKDVDQKLVNKCKDYIDEVNNFYYYKHIFDKINYDRESKQKWFGYEKYENKENIKLI